MSERPNDQLITEQVTEIQENPSPQFTNEVNAHSPVFIPELAGKGSDRYIRWVKVRKTASLTEYLNGKTRRFFRDIFLSFTNFTNNR